MKLKTKTSRKPKGLLAVMYETYKDFAENTSLHGLKYTIKTEVGITEKIFWMMVLISGLCCAIYMTFLFWDRYITNPTRTTIKTMYAPTNAVQFPAVTICNVNGIFEEKLDIFLERLNIEKSEIPIVRDSFRQLLSFTDPTAVDYNESEINILQDVLDQHHYDVSYVMQHLAQNCSEMLKFCSWNARQFECSDLFSESLTVNGFCCSFSYMPKAELYTLYNGVDTGLVAILNATSHSTRYSFFHFQGFKVFIHDPMEYPVLQSITRMMSTGKLAYLQLYASKITCSDAVKILPFTQRNCVYPEEKKLSSFETYTSSNCLAECEALYFYKTCKCVPYFYNFLDQPQCNVTHIGCILEVRKADLDFSDICDCPVQCEDDYYEVFSTQAKFDYKQNYSMVTYANVEMDHRTILLNVFFTEQTQIVYLRDTIFSTVYLLSSFGGVYSLFLGCSLITVIEVIYYATVRLIVNWKIFERADGEDFREAARPKIHIPIRHFQNWNNATIDFNSTFLP